MIWLILFQFLSDVISGLSSIVPDMVVVTTLPFGVDSYFADGMATVYAIAAFFPPAITMIHIALAVAAYLVLRRITLKLLLGQRAPV